MMKKRKFILLHILLAGAVLSGCSLKEMPKAPAAPVPIVVERGRTVKSGSESGEKAAEEQMPDIQSDLEESSPEESGGALDPGEMQEDLAASRVPVKAKGIYVSAYVAGTPDLMDGLIAEMDRTEANAMVIDLKDDYGRVVCQMDSPLVHEIGSVKNYIPDVESLMEKLKAHDIYTIARIPLFRDDWLGEVRPDWCVKRADGSVFEDRDGNAWVNPYKKEAWDYFVEIAVQAGELGFDEVQFDYVRFCTEEGMSQVVFDESDVQGRSRTDIIGEFMEYAYEILRKQGLFVSADVFGAIINSGGDAEAIGQIYGEMAKHLDYISPMIYPSHYAKGNYGIDDPDLHPYETVYAALKDSRKILDAEIQAGEQVAAVRPWLQNFTAVWLDPHMKYGAEQVRAQMDAVIQAGYEEWLLWDASCRYHWDGFLKEKN